MRTLFKIRNPASSASFSLVELLMVVALIAVVVTVALAGYAGSVQSTALSAEAATLGDALMQGRASAVAQGTPVEVRIYDVPPQSGGAPAYDAMQLHWVKTDGTTPAVAAPLFLSSWVVIDPTAAHSSLIALNPQVAKPDAGDVRLNAQTRVFHFLPDGSIDLNPATNWFLTIRAANQSDPAHFPSNWACLRVDPVTGRTQVYRP